MQNERKRDYINHTSFFIMKELISLCYGLGMDMVDPDFPFQSIREKSFKRELEIKGMANSCFAVSFFVIWRAGDKILQRKCTGLAAPCRDWQ